MSVRRIYALGLLIVAGSIILYARWWMIRERIPQLETAVRQEVVSLASSNVALHSLTLGQATRTHMVGSGVEMTGYFQFDGSYSNQSWDVIVKWRKADTNAPIDKIELHSTDQEPKIIWSRK